jgi:hypothetical protein
MTTKTFTSPTVGLVTASNLENMGGSDLVAIFNELTGESVKRFATRDAGMRRVLAALEEHGTLPVEESKPKAKKGTKGEPKPKRITKKALRASLTRVARHPGSEPREGTVMASILAVLQEENGATLNELGERFEMAETQVKGTIRLLNHIHGYGITQNDETGFIKAFR